MRAERKTEGNRAFRTQNARDQRYFDPPNAREIKSGRRRSRAHARMISFVVLPAILRAFFLILSG